MLQQSAVIGCVANIMRVLLKQRPAAACARAGVLRIVLVITQLRGACIHSHELIGYPLAWRHKNSAMCPDDSSMCIVAGLPVCAAFKRCCGWMSQRIAWHF
jgi:hypothetical protein